MSSIDIKKITGALANNREIVQASGGNVSIKLNKTEMLVKASGFRFDQIDESKGLVKVSYPEIADFYSSYQGVEPRDIQEHQSQKKIMLNVLDKTEQKPSMETGFHSVLQKYVIHTHPVFLNIYSSMKEGADHLQSIIDVKFKYLEYMSPGHQLSLGVAKNIRRSKEPTVIVLKNHGLIVASNNLDEAISLTHEISLSARDHMKTSLRPMSYPYDNLILKDGHFFCRSGVVKEIVDNLDKYSELSNKFFFPDAVVFLSKAIINKSYKEYGKEENLIQFVKGKGIYYHMNEKAAKNTDEVLNAYLYMLIHIKKMGVPDYLPDDEVQYILNMDAEKYRKKLMEK